MRSDPAADPDDAPRDRSSRPAPSRQGAPPPFGRRTSLGDVPPAELHHRLLEEYAPPSIVVAADYDIQHVSETAGRYLHVRGGEPSRELFRLLKPELAAALRGALPQAAQSRARVLVESVRVAFEGGARVVDVDVRPVIGDGEPAYGYFLLLFLEHAPGATGARASQVSRLDAERAHGPSDSRDAPDAAATGSERPRAWRNLHEATSSGPCDWHQQVGAEREELVQERTKQLQAEVARHADAERRVADLLRRIVTAQEDERARIARDLHDQLGQQLTALRLMLEGWRAQTGGDSARLREIDRAIALARRLDSDVDFLAWQLRPPVLDDLGLAAALPQFAREWSEHHDIAVEVRALGDGACELPKDVEVVFYRVAQEAFTNVLKHAHASRVDVLLERRGGGSIVLVIEDDGIGFDAGERDHEARGIGIAGMRERAALAGATLDIESSPGKGTSVYLCYDTASAQRPERGA